VAFIDIRFPPDISFDAVGGPGFNTTITSVDSGHEFSNRNWQQERSEYEVSHAARLPAQWQPLVAFFRVVGGRANTFRFKDFVDFEASASEGVFTLLTATTFQMWKRYTFGGSTYDRKITKPVSGTVTVTGGTTPTVNYATGVVTVAAGTPTAWAGQFDVHTRFDIDRMRHNTIDRNPTKGLIVGWDSIPLVEVRD